MSATHLNAKEGIPFNRDFYVLHERITLLKSIKSVGKNTKVIFNLLVFSIGFKAEGW